MKIKLSLNKLARFDNIEYYSLSTVYQMMKTYEDYVKDNDGMDISFPGFFIGKDAQSKAKHAKEERKKKIQRNRQANKMKK